MTDGTSSQLFDVFRDIIQGRVVKRSLHDLRWESTNVTDLFIKALHAHGYRPMTVGEVLVEPGERVPAFYITEETAYFGWVFWEKFTDRSMRKLFGSTIRNSKGDWAIQISPQKKTILYANSDLKTEMDIERPFGF